MEDLQSLLKSARLTRKISQRELSQISGVSHIQIAKYETGKSQPSLAIIAKLTRALNLPKDYFLRHRNASEQKILNEAFRNDLAEIQAVKLSSEEINLLHGLIKLILKANKMQKGLEAGTESIKRYS